MHGSFDIPLQEWTEMDIQLHNIPHVIEELACRHPEWRQYLHDLRVEQGDSDALEIEDYWKRRYSQDQVSRDGSESDLLCP